MSPERNVSPVPSAKSADLQGKGGNSGDGGNRTRATFPPSEPSVGRTQRARVTIQPKGDEQHSEDGWACLDGAWLHFCGDEINSWETYPALAVVLIEWVVA